MRESICISLWWENLIARSRLQKSKDEKHHGLALAGESPQPWAVRSRPLSSPSAPGAGCQRTNPFSLRCFPTPGQALSAPGTRSPNTASHVASGSWSGWKENQIPSLLPWRGHPIALALCPLRAPPPQEGPSSGPSFPSPGTWSHTAGVAPSVPGPRSYPSLLLPLRSTTLGAWARRLVHKLSLQGVDSPPAALCSDLNRLQNQREMLPFSTFRETGHGPTITQQ